MRVAMFEGYGESDFRAVVRARSRRVGEFGAIVYTPGQMLDAATALDSEYAKLDGDVRSSRAPDSFKSAWSSHLATWRSFFSSLQGPTGYAKRLWGGTQEEIDRYRDRLVSWQDSFLKAGGAVTGALAARPPAGALGDITKLLVAGAVLYALVTFGPAIARSIGLVSRASGERA